MSQSILLGNGWHPPLFRSEINALFGELKILHPRIVLLDQPIDETFLTRVSRAALVDDVINFGGYSYRSDFDSITDEISNWCKKNLPSGSFAVRSKKLGSGVESISRRDLEKEVGARLFSENNPVNLHEPDFEIIIILAGEVEGEVHRDFFDFDSCIVWGIRDNNWEKTVVFGHTPVRQPIVKNNMIGIDTGCVYEQFGKLTAVLLPEIEFVQQKRIDF